MGKIKGIRTTSDYLSMEEFGRLVDGLRGDGEYMWELYCMVSFCTALRVSDVLSLNWGQLLGERFDIVERKTGKGRQITINPSVLAKIRELYVLMGSPEQKLSPFLNLSVGKPYSIMHINRMLKRFKVRYRINVPAISTHSFRKTFGRYVYESNGKSAESLILLNSIFRHSSIDTTKVYIGLRQAEIDNVFNSIKI